MVSTFEIAASDMLIDRCHRHVGSAADRPSLHDHATLSPGCAAIQTDLASVDAEQSSVERKTVRAVPAALEQTIAGACYKKGAR